MSLMQSKSDRWPGSDVLYSYFMYCRNSWWISPLNTSRSKTDKERGTRLRLHLRWRQIKDEGGRGGGGGLTRIQHLISAGAFFVLQKRTWCLEWKNCGLVTNLQPLVCTENASSRSELFKNHISQKGNKVQSETGEVWKWAEFSLKQI